MRRGAAALALLLAGNASAGDFAVGFNTLSLHSQPNYEIATPGIYVRGDGEIFGELGLYRNSIGFPTVHAAIGYSYKAHDWDVSLAAGFSYGYRERKEWYYPDGSAPNFYTYGPPKINPLVMPSVGYRITPEWGARIFLVPAIRNRSDAYCVSLAIERTFR
jgi:hypothetical protein